MRPPAPESLLPWIRERHVTASGPGGQHVNRNATAIQLRFAARECNLLPEGVRSRLCALAGSRCNRHGEILIQASEHRSLKRNRQAAHDRLQKLLHLAHDSPKRRLPTQPSAAHRKAMRLRNDRRSRHLAQRRAPVPIDP